MSAPPPNDFDKQTLRHAWRGILIAAGIVLVVLAIAYAIYQEVHA